MKLRPPETCPNGHGRLSGHVVDSRVYQPTATTPGYRRRRHKCEVCSERWTSYQSLVNLSKIRFVNHKYIALDAPN